MSAPANLFIETPNVQDLALTRLSTDVKAWPEEIIQKFKERIPEAAGVQMIVKFTKQDPENGTATGAIMLNTAAKTAVIPVIVRESMMHPLDIMIAEGRELPLTPDFFQAVFAQNGAFASVEEYPVTFGGGIQGFAGADPSITNTTYPPSMTRYASMKPEMYAAQAAQILEGVPSLLDVVLPTASAKQIDDFKQTIEKNAASFAGYAKRGNLNLLKKITSPKLNGRGQNGVESEIKDDRASFESVKKPFIMIRSKVPGKYEIMANEYGEYSPAFRAIDKRQMRSFISEIVEDNADEIIREIDTVGEGTIAQRATDVPTGNDKSQIDAKLEDVKAFGTYAVRTKSGKYSKGFVITEVIDFDQKKTPYKIFLGENVFSIQGSIVGLKMTTAGYQPTYGEPAAGDTGIFLFYNGRGAISTGPVVVKRIVIDPDDFVYIHGSDHNGKNLTVKMNPAMHLERIAKASGEDSTYLMPPMMKWVRLGKFEEVSSTKELFHIKTAADGAMVAPGSDKISATVINQGYGTYALKGLDPYVKKAGWDPTLMSRAETKFILHSLGQSLSDCDGILKAAQSQGQLQLRLPRVPFGGQGAEKTASVNAKLEKISGLIRRDFFKEAALVESAQTVDSLLALNFVNPDNIAKMVSKIPQLKAVISACASLLLASRLGMSEIPEQSTSTAMMRLLEVTDGLEKLRAAQQTQAETT